MGIRQYRFGTKLELVGGPFPSFKPLEAVVTKSFSREGMLLFTFNIKFSDFGTTYVAK